MAITGYFIDKDQEYREILLGFEPLHRAYSGVNLSEVVFDLLQEHQITDRVLSVTTDNASNNKTLIGSVHGAVEGLRSLCLQARRLKFVQERGHIEEKYQ